MHRIERERCSVAFDFWQNDSSRGRRKMPKEGKMEPKMDVDVEGEGKSKSHRQPEWHVHFAVTLPLLLTQRVSAMFHSRFVAENLCFTDLQLCQFFQVCRGKSLFLFKLLPLYCSQQLLS
ncbi:hypothetical protein KP509_11G054500 [Ceratopteris richardii]|uniref:Uncharacterized protein n=1 Tax=Ceratopteris richardii TaxID=49495 RepID=A0A8T2TT35_CERRI|nr:hypothetical protein KP509_11G054500 [Ceratopteris richardii]